MAYLHQSSLPEQSKEDGPKDIHMLNERVSREVRSGDSLKHRKRRKYLEEYEPEHMPSSEPMMPDIPILHTQESGAKENDVHHTSVKDWHGNDLHIGNLSSCSEAHANVGWGDWSQSRTDVGWRDWSQSRTDVGCRGWSPSHTNVGWGDRSQTRTDVRWRDWSQSHTDVGWRDWSQSRTNVGWRDLSRSPEVCDWSQSLEADVAPSLEGSASAFAQERDDEFVFVDNFKVPKEYEILYKKIYGKYGHIATKKVIKSSDTVLEACVSSLLRIIAAMETKRGVELSEELLNEWEGIIKDAEALKFNVKWFREGFERLKSQWMSDSDEQVLDAMQAEYVGLCTRKDELETDLSEVKTQMKKAEAKISSKREAIREKQTQKFIFQNEPVLSIVLSS